MSWFGRKPKAGETDAGKHRGDVCPVERAGALDNRIRRWLQDPRRLLEPLVREGMTVLDLGCGPGFFLPALAELVGETGQVIAADLQQGMLDLAGAKLEGTGFEHRVRFHRCPEDGIGLDTRLDLVLLFHVVHEMPDKYLLFETLHRLLDRHHGKVLFVEPPFHVSRSAFNESLRIAREAGFTVSPGPHLLLNKTALLGYGETTSASR
jgi:ubiquinone/menaquinone biosynthesis C-methylase UbiE